MVRVERDFEPLRRESCRNDVILLTQEAQQTNFETLDRDLATATTMTQPHGPQPFTRHHGLEYGR